MSANDFVSESGTITSLMHSLEMLCETELREMLAYTLKVYIIDKEVKSDEIIAGDKVAVDTLTNTIVPRCTTFPDLITHLKAQYHFEELNAFDVDSDTVYLTVRGERFRLLRSSKKDASFLPDTTRNESAALQKDLPKKTGLDRFSSLEIE